MTNCPFKESEYRDIEAINQIKSVKKAPFGKLVLPFFLYFLNRYARDNARTPMQWSDEKNAGFTTGEPWLKINPNYKEINATEQEARDDSVLNFYRKILKIRKEHSDVVKNGKFLPIEEKNKNIIAYIRKTDDEELLVICSLSPRKAKIKIPDSILKRSSEIILKNSDNIPELKSTTTFEPCTCAVWKLR